MSRTQKEYEEVFEVLVRYSDFKKVDKILGNDYKATNENLRDCFQDIHEDKSNRTGKDIRVTRKFAYEFGKAFWRLVKSSKPTKTYHEVGGGKSLAQDRKITAKEVVTSKDEYMLKGASKVDLKGYDTKTKKKKLRKSSFKVRGKPIVRFRDSKGRFVKRY